MEEALAATPPPADTQAALVERMIPVATFLVYLYAVLGALLVLLSATLGDDIAAELRLSFKDYLGEMATAVGALAIGRGILANAKRPVP